MAFGRLPNNGPQKLRGALQMCIRSTDTDPIGLCLDNDANTPTASGFFHQQKKKENDEKDDEEPEIELLVCCNGNLDFSVHDQFALVGSLNARAALKDLPEGAKLHASIIKVGLLDWNIFIGGALVNVYAKCAALEKAQLVLDDLPVRNVVCWNGLIAGYVQRGLREKALSCYDWMRQEGLSPDEVTFSCILKACTGMAAADKGKEIHSELVRRGLMEQDIVLGNALMDFYIKRGALAKAHQVFEELPDQNVVSWTTLICGCCQHGHCERALNYFELMKQEELSPDSMTFSCILKACGSIGALERGRQIHAEMIKSALIESDKVLENSLLDMYAKCGALAKAKLVFQELHRRDVVSWNVLMGGYCEHGLGEEALRCFELMSNDALLPDEVTYSYTLKACSSIGAAEKGREIHAEIMRQGYLGKDNKLGNALVDMYAKCGVLARAQQVFKELQVRDVVGWTSLISGLCQYGHSEDALNYFEALRKASISLDIVALAGMLKATSAIGATNIGKELHAEIVKRGLVGIDTVLGDALVDMYAKCGVLAKAQQLFHELPIRTRVSWNAVIVGHCQQGHGERTLHYYELMKFEGVDPDSVTYSCILKACSSVGAADKGQGIHAEIARKGFLENGTVLGNALLDMYIKCGFLVMAQQVFDELPCRNIVSWNVLIAGYCQYDHNEEAVGCFECMKHEGLSPDAVTFACAFKACGSMGATEKGKEIHVDLARKGFLANDPMVGSALVDMYAKCGALSRAREVFNKLPTLDVVLWTTLIAGYCEHGLGEAALKSFVHMRHAGHSPDVVTFACILKACGSIGATDEGQMHFESISRRYGIMPTVEHHTSMVDLHGRAGRFDEAMALIKKMPSSDQLPAWLAFLGACRKWCNLKLGKMAFEQGVGPNRQNIQGGWNAFLIE
ncbi:hypothetical protein GOP47_0026957 [Adiantum capillus-veneris]|nr:hypothetical protein GOP47_0026957 [Adiantum capillus-veneris]